jgi:hypothetical protein
MLNDGVSACQEKKLVGLSPGPPAQMAPYYLVLLDFLYATDKFRGIVGMLLPDSGRGE